MERNVDEVLGIDFDLCLQQPRTAVARNRRGEVSHATSSRHWSRIHHWTVHDVNHERDAQRANAERPGSPTARRCRRSAQRRNMGRKWDRSIATSRRSCESRKSDSASFSPSATGCRSSEREPARHGQRSPLPRVRHTALYSSSNADGRTGGLAAAGSPDARGIGHVDPGPSAPCNQQTIQRLIPIRPRTATFLACLTPVASMQRPFAGWDQAIGTRECVSELSRASSKIRMASHVSSKSLTWQMSDVVARWNWLSICWPIDSSVSSAS